MNEDVSRVMREAEEAASGIGSRILDVLARRVGLHSGASTAFGDPVEREGVTVVPVAKVRWGFGGGHGRGSDSDDSTVGEVADWGEGSGGGGGAMASPLGFIEMRDGQAEFRRINDPVAAVPLILVGGFTAWLLLRTLRGFVRR